MACGYFLILLLSAITAQAQMPVPVPYKDMLSQPVEYAGLDGQSAEWKDGVLIGLFSPDESHAIGKALVRGVSLAIEQANREGGYRGIPFRVVQRWATDTWGAGSKEMIRLVYEDRVCAVIGSIDSDSTHIAEQIATKARVPLLSSVTSDSTLNYIRIPWIFRLAPSNEAQAECMLQQGIMQRFYKRVGVIGSTQHEGRMSANALLKTLGKHGIQPLFHFTLPTMQQGYDHFTQSILPFNPDCLIIHLPAESLLDLLSSFQCNKIQYPIYLPWIPTLITDDIKNKYTGEVGMIQPFESIADLYPEFQAEYRTRFDEDPDPCAAYAFDAARMIIHAIQERGPKRKEIREAISLQKNFPGATGVMNWDNGGGNAAKPAYLQISGE